MQPPGACIALWGHPDERRINTVERSPDVLSGAWRFRGMRGPMAALVENLRDGATIEESLNCFPGVTREQVEVVLDYEADVLQTPATP
jgi:uncharacterized protein (DUF433 family)